MKTNPRYTAAKKELAKVGAAHAAGDALAACYALIGARLACVNEVTAFEALVQMADDEKLHALSRWRADPFSIFSDLDWHNLPTT